MLGILLALYSGPASDPVDWQAVLAADKQIPIAVVVNPNNGPGNHLYTDYLNPIRNLNAAGDVTLGYIPTRNGRMPLSKVRQESKLYFKKYHVTGIFLDEMPDQARRRSIKYYDRVVRIIWKIHPGASIFGNPGTDFPRTFLKTGIQTFVEEEDTGVNVLATPPAQWTKYVPASTFAEIAYDTPFAELANVESALHSRNVDWVYVTNGTGSNPYAKLPSYWNQEVKWVKGINNRSMKTTPEILMHLGTDSLHAEDTQKSLDKVRLPWRYLLFPNR